MAFDPRKNLEIAEFLRSEVCNSLDREACLRALVGRAYYAALIYARNCAEDSNRNFTINFRPSKDSIHKYVIGWYHGQGNAMVEESLKDLQQWRNPCDYQREIRFDLEKIASQAISEAHKIITSL